MALNFVLNSKNLVPNIQTQNQFQYNFPQGSMTITEGTTMSINQITLPYSWRNISSSLGNNTFTYYIPNSSNTQVAYNLTIPDGFYTVSDINTFLQAQMKLNGHYWYSNVGNYSTQFQFVAGISALGGSAGAWTATLTINSSNSPQVQLIIGTSISGYQIPAGSYISAQSGSYVYTISNASSSVSQVFTANATVPLYGSQGSELTPTIIYPLTISTTSSLYANTITSITIPTASNIQNILGSGYQYPSGGDNQGTWTGGYPTSGNQYALLSFPATSSTTQTIGNLLGFTSSGVGTTYYPTNTTTSALQTVVNGNSLTAQPAFPPKGTSVNGVIVRCNLISNNVSYYNDVLDCIPIQSTTYGSNINYLPISNNDVALKAGKYSSLVITFNDDNFNSLYMLDPTVLISLIINFPEKK